MSIKISTAEGAKEKVEVTMERAIQSYHELRAIAIRLGEEVLEANPAAKFGDSPEAVLCKKLQDIRDLLLSVKVECDSALHSLSAIEKT